MNEEESDRLAEVMRKIGRDEYDSKRAINLSLNGPKPPISNGFWPADLKLIMKAPIPEGYYMLPQGALLAKNDLWYNRHMMSYELAHSGSFGSLILSVGFLRLIAVVAKEPAPAEPTKQGDCVS